MDASRAALAARGDVVGILTTINEVHNRVAMHAVRVDLLQAQAEAVGLPFWKVPIPAPAASGLRTSHGRDGVEDEC